jgi:hypothetical protein
MTSVLYFSLLRLDHVIQKLHHCTMIKLIVVGEGINLNELKRNRIEGIGN